MKKLLVLLTILSCAFSSSFSQTFPSNTTQGNAATRTNFPGAVNTALQNRYFADTTAANAVPYLKFTPHLQIKAGENVYIRNTAATAWLLLGNTVIYPDVTLVTYDSATHTLCITSGGIQNCQVITTDASSDTLIGIDSASTVGNQTCLFASGVQVVCFTTISTIDNSTNITNQIINIVDSSTTVNNYNYFGNCINRVISGSATIDSLFAGRTTVITFQLASCSTYTVPAATFNITPSTNADRYSLVYVDTLGNVGTIDGTSNPASIPNVSDDLSQIAVVTYFIPAFSTTPIAVTSDWVYRERDDDFLNLRGTVTTGFDSAYTVNPFAGLYSLRIPTQVSGEHFDWLGGTKTAIDYSFLTWHFRLSDTVGVDTRLAISFYNDSSLAASNSVIVTSGSFGYDRTVSGAYQDIAIPFNSWNWVSPFFNKIRVTFLGNSSVSQQWDEVKLQTGGVNTNQGSFVQSVNNNYGPHVNLAIVDSGAVSTDTSDYDYYDKRTQVKLFSLPTFVKYVYYDSCFVVDTVGRNVYVNFNTSCSGVTNMFVSNDSLYQTKYGVDHFVSIVGGGGGGGGVDSLFGRNDNLAAEDRAMDMNGNDFSLTNAPIFKIGSLSEADYSKQIQTTITETQSDLNFNNKSQMPTTIASDYGIRSNNSFGVIKVLGPGPLDRIVGYFKNNISAGDSIGTTRVINNYASIGYDTITKVFDATTDHVLELSESGKQEISTNHQITPTSSYIKSKIYTENLDGSVYGISNFTLEGIDGVAGFNFDLDNGNDGILINSPKPLTASGYLTRTLPLSAEVNGTEYFADSTGKIDLGTIGGGGTGTNDPDSLGGLAAADYLKISDTAAMLLPYRNQINTNTANIAINTAAILTKQAQLNGTGFVKMAGTTVSYVPNVSLTTEVTGILPVANGGTGTSTPAITAGTNITSVTGTWPNVTINAATQGGGGALDTTYTGSLAYNAFKPVSVTNGDTTVLLSSSIGIPYNVTANLGYPLRYGAAVNNYIQNYATSGQGDSTAVALTYTNIPVGNKKTFILDININDARRSLTYPLNPKTAAKIVSTTTAILANAFLASAIPANSGSVTTGGTWGTTTTAGPNKATPLGGLVRQSIVSGSTLTYTFTGNSLVIGTFSTDQVTRFGGDFTYALDGGTAVTYSGKNKTDGLQGQIVPNAIVLTNLGVAATHTIVITTTSTDTVRIDYFGILQTVETAPSAMVLAVQKIPGTYTWGGNTAVFNAADSASKSVVNTTFRNYPVTFIDINQNLSPLQIAYQADSIHPNELGQAQIAQAIIQKINNFTTNADTRNQWNTRGGNFTYGDTLDFVGPNNLRPLRFKVAGRQVGAFDSTGNFGVGLAASASSSYQGVGKLNIHLVNTDYTNAAGAGSHLLLHNTSASGQTVLATIINGSVRSKMRTDVSGNINWVSTNNTTSGGHFFFTGGDFGTGKVNAVITNTGIIASTADLGGSTVSAYSMDVRGTAGVSTDVKLNYTSGATVIGSNAAAGTGNVLDVVSTTKGARPYPSMTTVQRDAISTPAEGTSIYNTTIKGNQTYKNSSWSAREAEWSYVAKTATYGLAITDNTVNFTTGTDDAVLPSAIGIPGKVFIIKNSGSGVVTVKPNTNGIATLSTITGGTSYTTGTYLSVPLTGGTGTGALATVTVAGGAVTAVTITAVGSGYTVSDVLSAVAGNVGGTGSGFSVPVATLASQTIDGASTFSLATQYKYVQVQSDGANFMVIGNN